MPAGEKVTVGREYIMPVCLARPFISVKLAVSTSNT
tara:strand:- start:367 stop:474 length:108 start_codon:yes stop_codon:yes gene_type:complete